MMYLVLTALLAMNVSKEILDAFVSINASLVKNSDTFDITNRSVYAEFESKSAANPEKVGPWLKKAKEVEKAASEMAIYINELKARVMAVSHVRNQEKWTEFVDENGKAIPLDHELITKKDENQENTTMLYGSDPKSAHDKPWGCMELKNKLIQYGELLASIAVSPRVKTGITNTFTYEDGIDANKKPVTWENKKFFHSPLAAVITELSTLEADVKRAESEVINDLYSNIESASYKFNKLAAVVIPFQNYILRGDTFRANIFLAAYDTTNKPRIFMDSQKFAPTSQITPYEPPSGAQSLKMDNRGFGVFKVSSNTVGLGDHQFRGKIAFDGPKGEEFFDVVVPPFTVAEPALVVSPTQMNVFYRGVDNPVEISVPGIPADKITPSISSGHQLIKSGNSWVVKPGTEKTAKISVSATMPDGSKKSMGDKEFRVKSIPDPVPSIQGRKPSDNAIALVDLKSALGIKADMENFDFDVKVSVQSFTMLQIKQGMVTELKSNSNQFSGEQKTAINALSKGNTVTFQDILVKMPDGSTRKLANLAFKLI
jgi:gliding motility-associated protein GldM